MRNSPALLLAVAALAVHWAPAEARQRLPQPDPLAGVPSPPDNPVPGGQVIEITLDEAVALGLRRNRTVQAAHLQRAAERFDLYVAERAFAPRGELRAEVVRRVSGGVTRSEASVSPGIGLVTPLGTQIDFTWQLTERLGGAGGGLSQSATVSVSQPLVRGAGPEVNLAPVRIARLQERINRLRLEGTVSDTITAIVFAYRALMQAQEQVRLADISLERARALLETNRRLVEAGRMAAADIVQTESAVAAQDVARLQAEQNLNSAQLALTRLLALDPRTNIQAAGPVDAEYVAVDTVRAVQLALDNRVDVLAQDIAVQQARQSLVLARDRRRWDVSLFGAVTQRGAEQGLAEIYEDETDVTAGVRVEIPLGDVSAEQGVVRARTSLDLAELRSADLAQAVEVQVRDAVQQVEARWRQVETARRARDLAERALELEQEKLQAGRTSNFEILSLQAGLRTADIQALAAEIAYLNALTALDQQIGSTLETWRITLEP
ncbi:TolC family protein [Maricaulis sp.]|uniref:TolC family protein n=1 Tax=Maricaulis sp. TaxID=1486257 RepID=UPI003299BB7D